MTNEELVSQIQAGDHEKLEPLLVQNQGMIRIIARRYLTAAQRNRALDMDDLMQAASLGMIEAATHWERDRGSFLELAKFHMRGTIRKALGMESSKTRIENTFPASLDAPVGENDDCRLVDLISDKALDEAGGVDGQATEAAYQSALRKTLDTCLDALNSRKAEILRRRYYCGETQETVAQLMGCTGANIGLLENKALKELYNNRETNGLKALCDYIEDHTNYYPKYGMKQFKYTATSAVEDIVLKRERLAKAWLRKQGIKYEEVNADGTMDEHKRASEVL